MDNKANLLVKIGFKYVLQILVPFIFSISHEKIEPQKLIQGGEIEVEINSCDTLVEVERALSPKTSG